MPATFELTVYGVPVPQGSKRIGRHGAHAVILDANDRNLKPWRKAVTEAARQRRLTSAQWDGPLTGPLSMFVCFTLPRPASAAKARRYPVVKPDLDKLLRALGDALTDAELWKDDSQLVTITATKRYVGDPFGLMAPGIELGVARL